MATKTWVGTTGVYTLDSNWLPISIRTSAYRWVVSGSGTNEYYLELAGGGNPGLTEPTNVQANAVNMAAGTGGALAAGQWDWDDNDTLGFNTVYVRLSDGTDPDSKSRDYLTYTQPAVAGDNVRIPAGSGAITGGDYSATAIADFVVEDGYSATIGAAGVPLIIDPDAFRFYGSGESYIDLHTANITAEIFKTAPPAIGLRGLYLTGSNIGTINVVGGYLGVASRSGETSTVATIRVVGSNADVWVGKGCSLTTMYQTEGKSEQRCASTTTTVYGGKLWTKETGAITTLNVRGGDVFPESTGTIGTLNADAGSASFLGSGAPRTVTTLKQNPGASVAYDPAVLTVTNRSAPDYPIRLDSSEP
jgi:hypothetical protein